MGASHVYGVRCFLAVAKVFMLECAGYCWTLDIWVPPQFIELRPPSSQVHMPTDAGCLLILNKGANEMGGRWGGQNRTMGCEKNGAAMGVERKTDQDQDESDFDNSGIHQILTSFLPSILRKPGGLAWIYPRYKGASVTLRRPPGAETELQIGGDQKSSSTKLELFFSGPTNPPSNCYSRFKLGISECFIGPARPLM